MDFSYWMHISLTGQRNRLVLEIRKRIVNFAEYWAFIVLTDRQWSSLHTLKGKLLPECAQEEKLGHFFNNARLCRDFHGVRSVKSRVSDGL